MEHVSNILNTASLNIKREEAQSSTALDPHITDIVNKLFAFFFSICRGFEKQYKDPKRLNYEKTQWIKAFTDAGFDSLQKIAFGIKKCRLESPINTPTIGQFIKWCTPTPEDLGIPSVEHAYNEACKNSHRSCTEKKWTHHAVYHAWSMCNSYELSTLPKNNTFPVFERNYDITVKMLMRGEKLKDIPKAIPSPQKISTPEDKEKADRANEVCMARMRKILGMSNDTKNSERMQRSA